MIRKRFVKIERGVASKERFDRVLPDHLRWTEELDRQGRNVFDGYWSERGGGMMIFDAASMDEARDLIAKDPFVVEGCVEFELKEWCVVSEPRGPIPSPGRHPGFHHVALRVVDLARSEAFYVDGFGMRVEWRPDEDNVYLTSGRDNLALHRLERIRDPQEPDLSLDHIGFVVRCPEDVDAFADRMKALKAPFRHSIKTHRDGARSCYVGDPDGNTVQIIYHPPLSGSVPPAAAEE